MTDLHDIARVFDALVNAGWLAVRPDDSGDIALCCMSCAKYELIPLNEAGTSCAWYTENDAAALNTDRNIDSPHGLSISVLGDITVVADLLRARFGDRVGRVTPQTADMIGFLCILPANPTAAMLWGFEVAS